MRIRHVASVEQLIHADSRVVADEYRSIAQAPAHEFRDDAESGRYAAFVHAWGMFAHSERFAADIIGADGAPTDAAIRVVPACRDCGGDSLVRGVRQAISRKLNREQILGKRLFQR